MEEPMANPKNNPKLPPNSGEQAGPKIIQRWSAARRREIVLRLLRGDSLDAISWEIGVEVYRLERWRDKALAAMDAGLKERADDAPVQGGHDAVQRMLKAQ
jgi:transposase